MLIEEFGDLDFHSVKVAEQSRSVIASAIGHLNSLLRPLTDLIRLCKTLSRLTVRLTGLRDVTEVSWIFLFFCSCTYEICRKLIKSNRATLRSLIIEQGLPTNFDPERLVFPFRSLDAAFARYILPSLVSGSWPNLQRVQLKGIASSAGFAPNHPAIPLLPARLQQPPLLEESILKQIRSALGPQVQLVVDHVARTFNSTDIVLT